MGVSIRNGSAASNCTDHFTVAGVRHRDGLSPFPKFYALKDLRNTKLIVVYLAVSYCVRNGANQQSPLDAQQEKQTVGMFDYASRR